MLHKPKPEELFVYTQKSMTSKRGIQRKFLECYCEFNEMKPYEAQDLISLAAVEKAPTDAVFRTGGFHKGKFTPGRWVCAWELSPNNPMIIWSHERIKQEAADYDKRKSERTTKRRVTKV
mgnify:CR=1 FL=1